MDGSLGLQLFALDWLQKAYQKRIAWISDEVSAIARQIRFEFKISPDAQRRIDRVLTDLRGAAIATMDSDQPVELLDRSILRMTARLQYETSLSKTPENVVVNTQLRLERLRAHATQPHQ